MSTTEQRGEEFPRPCKKCGNMAMIYKGKLVHVRGKRERCNMFRQWEFERDSKGQVKAMYWLGDVPIPDPLTPEQLDKEKLEEWNKLYSPEATR